MRRLIGWTAGLVGIAALARLVAARRDRTPPPALPTEDPAEELRRKLAESRAADAPAEPTRPSERNESLEQRRAHVHAKAQEALSAMDEIEGPT